jgi:hypothetical protein
MVLYLWLVGSISFCLLFIKLFIIIYLN